MGVSWGGIGEDQKRVLELVGKKTQARISNNFVTVVIYRTPPPLPSCPSYLSEPPTVPYWATAATAAFPCTRSHHTSGSCCLCLPTSPTARLHNLYILQCYLPPTFGNRLGAGFGRGRAGLGAGFGRGRAGLGVGFGRGRAGLGFGHTLRSVSTSGHQRLMNRGSL